MSKQEGPIVDPSLSRYFARRVWQLAQEKEYFEERRKYRQWWWDHTVVPVYNSITWGFAAVMLFGTINFLTSLVVIYIQFAAISIFFQINCGLSSFAVKHGCYHPLLQKGCPENVIVPLSYHLFNHSTTYYSFFSVLEEPFVRFILFYAISIRNTTLSISWIPMLNQTGLICLY